MFVFHMCYASDLILIPLGHVTKIVPTVCTAKAVKNRLYNWKKKNVSGDTGLNNSTTDTPLKISATPRTPRTKFKSMTKKRKSGESDSGLDDPANDDEDIKSPSTGRGKIGLHGTPFIYVSQESESEDTVAHKAKRVKTEPVDEDDSFEDPAYHAAYDHEAQRV